MILAGKKTKGNQSTQEPSDISSVSNLLFGIGYLQGQHSLEMLLQQFHYKITRHGLFDAACDSSPPMAMARTFSVRQTVCFLGDHRSSLALKIGDVQFSFCPNERRDLRQAYVRSQACR